MINIVGLLQNIFFIIVGIIGIGFLIGFHELGHFVFCKLFNIKTPSFSIGMGPRLIRKKIGETEFALSAIPLGGYVEIAGMAEVGQGEQQDARTSGRNSFLAKPYWQKLLVLLGGILFNIIFAYVVISALYYFGMPKTGLFYPENATRTINHIEPNSPAAQSALRVRDTVIALNKNPIKKPFEAILFIKEHPQEQVTFTIERDNVEQDINVAIGKRPEFPVGYLGIDFETPQPTFFESISLGIKTTHTIIGQVVQSFAQMFKKRSIENIGGPLMVISQTIKGAERGLAFFLIFLAFISINLAVLNMIPLPIMDGGQVVFYTIEAIIGRPLPAEVRMYIHYACWIAVLLLVIFLSIKDVFRMFSL